MENIIFPFAQTKNNSRIAIYGGGKVGAEIIGQLMATNYGRIVFVADRNSQDNKSINGINYVPPERLAAVNEYDYIVLATTNIDYRNQMEEFLAELGVHKEKILYVKGLNLQMNSYSQHGEDRIILEAFKHMGFFRNGKLLSYIDVGAHHPFNISNTALFYQMGCRGINIEANPELIKEFEIARPDDVNLCVGIGAKSGTFPFYITNVSGLNTFKKENLAYNEFLYQHDTGIQESYQPNNVIELPVRTLHEIISEYSRGIWPDFMSIDIEGMEYESLEICDLSKGPALIAVEVNFDGDLFIDMLNGKGYFPYLWYRENILFVKNEYEGSVHAHTERETEK